MSKLDSYRIERLWTLNNLFLCQIASFRGCRIIDDILDLTESSFPHNMEWDKAYQNAMENNGVYNSSCSYFR